MGDVVAAGFMPAQECRSFGSRRLYACGCGMVKCAEIQNLIDVGKQTADIKSAPTGFDTKTTVGIVSIRRK